MTNFQVYKKVISFSFLMFVVGLFAFALLIGTSVLGFVIGNNMNDMGVLGAVIGFVVGILLSVVINIFLTNRIRAAQIAIMVKGVNEGQLPERAFKAGFEEIKGRFGKITAFYFITSAIKGIFRQLGRNVNRVGRAIGGQAGESVTSAIDSAIQTLISYLCDCCLGWILYRQEVNAAKAGCEGAVIFFKHGKTLFTNIGRIFGMGFLSLLVIGGGLFGILFAVSTQMTGTFAALSNEIIEIGTRTGSEVSELITNPTLLGIYLSALSAVILWSTIHSVLIRPFILVGVLRNFMAAGIKDAPKESDFQILDGKSAKFAKLHNSF